MSRVAVVLRSERVADDGFGLDVVVDPGGGANLTAPHFADLGDDSVPLPGDYTALAESSGTGAEHVSGYADTKNAGKAKAGEKRLYARKANGDVAVEVHLKNDGSIVIDNGAGKFEMKKSGDVVINGIVLGVDGSIVAAGEVTAKNAAGVPLAFTTHVHPTAPVGAPSPPQGPPAP